MSSFQYTNNASTTLSGAATSGASSISVTSATGFPTQGRFTIVVDSEIMLVTGVSGTTFTVTRGYENTTATAHSNNAVVTHILTVESFLNSAWFDPPAYGVKVDASTNDRPAIQAALDAAADVGGTVFLPSGTYLIGTSPLEIASNVVLRGEGLRSKIVQATSGKPVIVSSSYLAANSETPSGYTTIRDLYLIAQAAAGSHGIVLHDFYSLIENVVVEGGDKAFYLSEADDEGTAVAGTLVDNRIRNVVARSTVGYGIYAGADDNGKLTDGSIDGAILAGAGVNAINIGSSAGWRVNGVHNYMATTGAAIRLRAAFHTIVSNLYLEGGYTDQQILFAAYQRASTVNGVTAIMNSDGGDAVSLNKSGLFLGDGLAVNGLAVVQDTAVATTALNTDSTNGPISASGISLQGTNAASITLLGGGGAAVSSAPELLGNREYAEITADQTGIVGSFADLTGLSVTIASVGHRMRISAETMMKSTAAGDTGDLIIAEGGVNLVLRRLTFADANKLQSVHASVVLTPSAGSHTYKLIAWRPSGTGTITVAADASYPSYILVEDLGPAR